MQHEGELPQNGWLSPGGEMFSGERACHTPIANRFFPESIDSQRSMELGGWWKLTNLSRPDAPEWFGCVQATSRQMQFITNWCREWSRQAQYDPWLSRAEIPDFRGLVAV